MTKMTRLERASAVLLEAMGNYLAAVSAELQEARSTVAPHSHPDVPLDDLNLILAEAQAADVDEVAAKPAALASCEEKVWTPARLALLQIDYTAGVELDDMWARLSALPGAPLNSRKSIAVLAARNRWRRPEATSRARQEATPASNPDACLGSQSASIAAEQGPAGSILATASEKAAAANGSPGWTSERRDYLRVAWARGDSCSTIGRALGISVGAVQGARTRQGLPARPSAIIRKPVAAAALATAPARASHPRRADGLPSAPAAPQKLSETPSPAPADRWTAERLAIAQPMYEAGAPIIEIAVAVNAEPGPIVKIPQINLLAGAKGWTRGKPAAAAPVVANDGQIRQWAGDRGIVVHGKDLPMGIINGRRTHLGLPPFELAVAHRGRVI